MMNREMKVVETYNGHKINFINFAQWYTVFTHNQDGTTAMHHFDTPEQTKEFIDAYEKDRQEKEKQYWWNK